MVRQVDRWSDNWVGPLLIFGELAMAILFLAVYGVDWPIILPFVVGLILVLLLVARWYRKNRPTLDTTR